MHRTIITWLAAAGLGIGLVGSASAAPVTPPPYYHWTGFYVGGIAGGAWGTFDTSTSTVSLPGDEFNPGTIAAFNAAGRQSIKPGTFVGGLEAGYNWRKSSYLFGLEGDIEWLHFSGSATSGPISFVPPPGTFTIISNASIDWLATARARVGFVANNWLFYATGGAAFTTLHGNFTFSETFAGSSEAASVSRSKVGYAVGGGVETYLWRRWSIKAEYLFVDFGNVSASGNDFAFPIAQPFTHTMALKLNVVRLGLNYHF